MVLVQTQREARTFGFGTGGAETVTIGDSTVGRVTDGA